MVTYKKRSLDNSKILRLLEPMMNVSIVQNHDEKNCLLIKNTVKFGVINDNNEVFLFNKQSKGFKRINDNLSASPDKFLRKATQAYWAAANIL